MAGKVINIELGAEQQALLQRQLESDPYESLSEMYDAVLRLVNQPDAAFCKSLRKEARAPSTDRRPPSSRGKVFKRLRAKVRKAKTARRGA
jgi:hypothetical protein